ncbi:MAG: hypothetical protein WC485_12175 [Opitutaceae bacterium]
MTNESSQIPRRNWPLIWGGVAAGLLAAAVVAGLIALYVCNFNLLDWIE